MSLLAYVCQCVSNIIANRMRIPLLVVDDSPPDYSSTEYKVARGKGPMKYASEGEEPPMVEVEVRPHLAIRPKLG